MESLDTAIRKPVLNVQIKIKTIYSLLGCRKIKQTNEVKDCFDQFMKYKAYSSIKVSPNKALYGTEPRTGVLKNFQVNIKEVERIINRKC